MSKDSGANRIVVVEVTQAGKYKGQLGYPYCPLFPIKQRDLEKFVESRMPDIKGKKYNIDFIKSMEEKEYKRYKIYRKD